MPEAPATVGRYHIERLIAHGGMGSLYLARDPAIDRLVAIKLLRDGFDDAAVRERFAREARSAGRLHHPNIVTVFDVGEHQDRPFIAMEYVSGETLAQLIKRGAIGRLWQKLAILEDICSALHYAHGAAIVHRDIKPANVMVDDTGLVRILDFGIARAEGVGITQAGDLVGTLNYMSPEQLAGEQVDHRTDIYSVGVLAYELVTNQMAFPGTIQTGVLNQILNSGPPAIATLVPDVDPDVPAIIERAMARTPEARYQDLESLRQDLVVVRTRLLETRSDTEETPDPEAETRVYSGGVGSGTQPRSSLRLGSTQPSGARGTAVRSAIQPAVAKRRTAPLVLGVAVASLAVGLAAIWTYNKPPATTPPVHTEATAQTEPPQPAAPVAPPTTSPTPSADPAREARRAELEAQLRDAKVTARQQIAAGERQAALETLRSGLALDATDAELNALIDEQIRVARQAATQAGAAAAKRGQRSSAVFQDAQTRERQAESLMRAGDRVPAIEAFWAATSRYNQVPESPAAGQRATAAPPAPEPAAPPIVPVEPAAVVPGSSTISTAPPPAPKPLPSPVEKRPASPETPPPAAAKPDVAREAKPDTSREPKPDPTAVHEAAIRETLRRYSAAYQSLDSRAVASVMPSLTPDQRRGLERDFANYRSYNVEIRDERIAIDDTAATAIVACQVVRAYVMRDGVAGGHTATSTFHLRRSGSVWTIERLESR